MEKIHLSQGAGGEEMNELVMKIIDKINIKSDWVLGGDSAHINIGSDNLFFTSDSYTVDPIFFNGGDIGKIAFCGTVNDILMSGGKPLGVSLSFVIEEGFEHLSKIIDSLKKESLKYNIPIVTGDTKVVEKGSLKGIIINTSGIGIGKPFNKEIVEGDSVIVSRNIGNHGVALLASRYDFETDIETDSKQLVEEVDSIRNYVKLAKDATRGGIAAVLNEISEKINIGMELIEEKIPIDKKVKKMCEILGVNIYELANEGTMIVIVSKDDEEKTLDELKKFNQTVSVMGTISKTEKNRVIIKTKIGRKVLRIPTGNIVPRIC
ncbi:hydrogenase expression/formation protein HypE [Candidatus Woesearchaeota archaeon]|nr:MAG: hydrogenase expression/formation protein HypE [Candidatus Woesearchaeota archaeon]